jgi:hypothetical protein
MSPKTRPAISGSEASVDKKPEATLVKRSKGGRLVERPGMGAGLWERWLFCDDRPPELLADQNNLSAQEELLVCLPSSTLFAWPLWIAREGDSLNLVRLELSGRHLLKRGMENSLVLLPILQKEDRQLVLAVAPEEPFSEELMPPNWKTATRFELPARLLAASLDHELVLWMEWGELYLAFYRDQKPVWFSCARAHDIAGLIHRISLRLLSEGILAHLPSSIHFESIPDDLYTPVSIALTRLFPQARLSHHHFSDAPSSPPILPGNAFDLPPEAARDERGRSDRRKKLFSFIILGSILYLILLLWGAGDLLIRQTALKRLRHEIAKVEQPALDAQSESSRWHSLRSAIDPDTFVLDLLAAASASTQSGKVRLTLFSLEQGQLHLSGETSDVSEAYSTIEQLKKNPLLQQFDWTAGQPQLAGKNSVRFDMEGNRPDATPQSNTP